MGGDSGASVLAVGAELPGSGASVPSGVVGMAGSSGNAESCIADDATYACGSARLCAPSATSELPNNPFAVAASAGHRMPPACRSAPRSYPRPARMEQGDGTVALISEAASPSGNTDMSVRNDVFDRATSCSSSAGEASSQRSVTLVWGADTFIFGWRADTAPRAFGEELRQAVRAATGCASLEGFELHTEPAVSANFVARHVTPRDVFEGRADRVRIVASAAAATEGAQAGGKRLAAETQSCSDQRSRGAQVLPPRGQTVTVGVEGAAPQGRQREGRFQKRGGSQMEFMRMLALNKNPLPQLRAGVKLTRQEVLRHRKATDCWTIFQGKVYDVTSYLDFHPGGKDELMLGAGKDCTKEFNKIHPWVSIEGILGRLCLGPLEISGSDRTPE